MKHTNELAELEEVSKGIDLTTWEDERFYHISYSQKGDRLVKIDFYRLVKTLKMLGFARLDVDKKSFIVRVEENIVQECTTKDVVDAFEDYLDTFPDNFPDGVMKETIKAKLYGSVATYFSDHVLQRLRHDDSIQFNEDTKTKAFFYYKNGFIEVTQAGVSFLPYTVLTKKIWRGQILDREFHPQKAALFGDFPWSQFCANIANNFTDKKTGKPNDPERFVAFKTAVGYLLHGYFDGKLRCLIFTDSRISDEASGRTGKTLLFKAMQQIKNAGRYSKSSCDVNGKDFDPLDKFKWQDLALETSLVCLNDVRRNFNFETLFNDITEGIKCQRKNETPFLVKAKLMVTTNRTIRLHGSSSKDRSLEFEMADYYSADYSPEKEFGHWFFRDWDKKGWASFDNFMLDCVSTYLRHGLLRPNAINLLTRKLYEETSQEFVAWFEEKKIAHGERYDKKGMYEEFMREYKDQFGKLTPRTFTKWLKSFAEYQPAIYQSTEEVRSNGKDFIQFFYVDELVPAKSDTFDPDYNPDSLSNQQAEAEARLIFGN